MKILTVILSVLVIFTVFWSASTYSDTGTVSDFSTIQTTISFYEDFTSSETFFTRLRKVFDNIKSNADSMSNPDNNVWEKIGAFFKMIFNVLFIPLTATIDLLTWLFRSITNITRFITGGYLVRN